MLRYENKSINPREVGQALACDYILTGMVLKVGEQLRISVQLVKAKDDSPLWGDSFDVTRQDLLGLQDTIAERVSAALKIRMTAAERERVYRRYTENIEAYQLYLKGQAHVRRGGREERLAAVAAFDKALQLDLKYAPAHAGLAAACGILRHGWAPESEVKMWEERAKQAASRAVELDPDLAEAHEALAAFYRYTDFEWERTIEESRKALELNPNLGQPHFYIARAYYHLGLLDFIEPEVRAGLEIDPENKFESSQLRIFAALYRGRYAETVASSQEASRSGDGIWASEPEAHYYYGERELAEAMLTRYLQKNNLGLRQQLNFKANLASFLAARGARAQAEAILLDITSVAQTFHHASYSIGATYAQLGDKPKARLWLALAAQTGFPCYPWYERDPLLQPLRGDRSSSDSWRI